MKDAIHVRFGIVLRFRAASATRTQRAKQRRMHRVQLLIGSDQHSRLGTGSAAGSGSRVGRRLIEREAAGNRR